MQKFRVTTSLLSLVIVIGLVGCGLVSSGRSGAITELFADPIFSERPLGVGRSVSERFVDQCDGSMNRPSGSRTYQLNGAPQAAVDGYLEIARSHGWTVTDQHAVDVDEPWEGRAAQLVLERDEDGHRLVATVNAGLPVDGGSMTVTVYGYIADSETC